MLKLVGRFLPVGMQERSELYREGRSVFNSFVLTVDHKGGQFFTHLLYKNVNTKACNFLLINVFLHNTITKVCNSLHIHFGFNQVYIFIHTFVRTFSCWSSVRKICKKCGKNFYKKL